MVLKIDKVSGTALTVLKLSGRLESADLQGLQELLDGQHQRVALDLEQVQLVDLDTVCFLAVLEQTGVELRNCPGFIRQWILAEMPRTSELA